MSLFYTVISVILVLCCVCLLVMRYFKELFAIPHKEYIVLILVVLALGCYIVYCLMPSRHISDDQAKMYTTPYPWNDCKV